MLHARQILLSQNDLKCLLKLLKVRTQVSPLTIHFNNDNNNNDYNNNRIL